MECIVVSMEERGEGLCLGYIYRDTLLHSSRRACSASERADNLVQHLPFWFKYVFHFLYFLKWGTEGLEALIHKLRAREIQR